MPLMMMMDDFTKSAKTWNTGRLYTRAYVHTTYLVILFS